jgi:hypothetical protein
MKKILLFIFGSILLNSCVVTQKQRDKFCSNCPQITTRKDSVITKTEYRDTTIYVTTKPVTHTIASPCDSTGKLKNFKSTQVKNGIKTTIEGKDNKLTVTCNADSLRQVIEGLNEKITKEHFRSETKKIKEVCDKEHKTSFDYFKDWWFYITGGLLVLLLLYVFFLHRFVKRLPEL